MPIREELVTSAVNFLLDPNVTSSPVENKVSFLRSKNLTQEEIDTALARVRPPSGTVTPASPQTVTAPAQQSYYSQYQQAPPYGWQPPLPPAPPRRDWRDWFIMATVMGGVSYGLYSITKRYIYPLVSPPTPEKLEQDKATVDEQFAKAFAIIEQLTEDTEALKSSEQERTEKLDKIIFELESFMSETRSANRRQDDETDRLRDEMKSLKDVIPKSMSANKEFTDGRLREIANEVKSLKSLIGQRMSSNAPSSPSNGNYLRSTNGNAMSSSPTATPSRDAETKENGEVKESINVETPSAASRQDYISSLGARSTPFGSGMPAGKASIPAWQLAMAKGSGAGESASGSQEAGSSS